MKKGLSIILALMLGSVGAYALGTDAGTDINNSATLSYTAGGVEQPKVTSNTDSFVVDKKVDMIMKTDNTEDLPVVPGQKDATREFTFLNEGNADQYFKIDAGNVNGGTADYSGGGTDNEDVTEITTVEWSVDPNDGNCTGLSDGNKTGNDLPFVLWIPEDCQVKFVVSSNIPTAQEGGEDTDVMVIELNATAVTDSSGTTNESNTSGADTQDAVDVVLADGVSDDTLGETDGGGSIDTASDGIEKARSGYIISTPVLSVTKKSCVISDPVHGVSDDAKRIPGAVIRYLFDIENNGTAAVNDLNLTDSFHDKLILSDTADSAKKDENQTSACDCQPTDFSTKTDVSGDTTISNQDMTIEHINVDKAGSSPTHTCVWVEVEIE